MGKRKTTDEYNEEIAKLHTAFLAGEDVGKKLKNKVNTWYEKLEILVQVPGNELRKQWTPFETGFLTEPMPRKIKSGHDQTGDYIVRITAGSIEYTGGVVAERKALEDFYGTMTDEDHRQRLKDEIQRFKADPRLHEFIIFVEGSFDDLMNYPIPKVADIKKRREKKKQDIDWKPETPDIRQKRYQNSMKGKMAALEMDGIHIKFCGSRKGAADYYSYCIRHWCLTNYHIILGLEEQNGKNEN